MINWKTLGINTIGLFALSNRVGETELETARKRLEAEGVAVVMTKNLLSDFRRMAGNDFQRATAFNALLDNESVDLLMAVRGGYGAARCLDYIDWDRLVSRCIPIVGYSDVTALHLASFAKGARLNVMGPMACSQWGRIDDEALLDKIENSLGNVLAGRAGLPSWHGAQPLKDGVVSGKVIPVNLSLLCSLVGTDYLPDFSQSILVVEDVEEAAHAIDRMLNQLRQTGILGKLGGLVFGQFSRGDDAEYIPEIIRDYAEYVKGPVAFDLAFGHINPSISLPVGQEMILSVENGGVSLERII